MKETNERQETPPALIGTDKVSTNCLAGEIETSGGQAAAKTFWRRQMDFSLLTLYAFRKSFMAKASAQKKPNGTDSGLNFEAQLWADAEQAVPAPTWKLARMNLAIRGIDANLSPRNADSFRTDQHPDLKAHFILANGMRDLLLSGNSQMPSRE